MPVPLIHIAATGYLTVKQLPEHGADEYQVPYGDKIYFTHDGQKILLDRT
jgi:hypothetical protein